MAGSSDYPRLRGLLTVLTPARAPEGASPLLEDQHASSAHLAQAVLHHLSHQAQHIKRLADPEVQKDPKAMAFNLGHVDHHGAQARDHQVRLRDHLMQYPSDPAEFSKQTSELSDLQSGKDTG